MADHRRVALGTGLEARLCFTEVGDGDFRVIDPTPGVEDRRRSIVDMPWTWVMQVHGATVLEVAEPGQWAGAEADALVTAALNCPISVTTADCAPVVLLAERGVAVVHAGWRGLVEGIVGAAAQKLSAIAGRPVASVLGPCIGPAAYEFGQRELALVVERLGPTVEGRTGTAGPALDVPAAVAVACERAGWPPPQRPPCTSDPRWYSHRTRAQQGRQAAVAWLTTAEG